MTAASNQNGGTLERAQGNTFFDPKLCDSSYDDIGDVYDEEKAKMTRQEWEIDT